MRILLVSGLPRAGKTTLALKYARHNRRCSHLPLDKYIRPIPEAMDFLAWVALPECIDWGLLDEHLRLLASGQPCHPPSPDWSRRGARRDAGGKTGHCQPVVPAAGCIIPGCHTFSFATSGHATSRIFVKTGRDVIAQRLMEGACAGAAEEVLNARLSANWRDIESWERHADLVISGTSDRAAQLAMVDALG